MNLNVEVNDSCIDDAIETLMEGPLSDVKSESEEYTDACIEELKNELTEYVDDSVTHGDSSRIDDLTMRLENIEVTVKHLHAFKMIAAKDLSRFRKLRNVLADFIHFSVPTDSEVSNDDR